MKVSEPHAARKRPRSQPSARLIESAIGWVIAHPGGTQSGPFDTEEQARAVLAVLPGNRSGHRSRAARRPCSTPDELREREAALAESRAQDAAAAARLRDAAALRHRVRGLNAWIREVHVAALPRPNMRELLDPRRRAGNRAELERLCPEIAARDDRQPQPPRNRGEFDRWFLLLAVPVCEWEERGLGAEFVAGTRLWRGLLAQALRDRERYVAIAQTLTDRGRDQQARKYRKQAKAADVLVRTLVGDITSATRIAAAQASSTASTAFDSFVALDAGTPLVASDHGTPLDALVAFDDAADWGRRLASLPWLQVGLAALSLVSPGMSDAALAKALKTTEAHIPVMRHELKVAAAGGGRTEN